MPVMKLTLSRSLLKFLLSLIEFKLLLLICIDRFILNFRTVLHL